MAVQGFAIRAAERNQETRDARRKAVQAAVLKDRETSINEALEFANIADQTAPTGQLTPEQFQQFQIGALQALQRHASTLDQNRQFVADSLQRLGGRRPRKAREIAARLSELPTGEQFINEQLPMLEARFQSALTKIPDPQAAGTRAGQEEISRLEAVAGRPLTEEERAFEALSSLRDSTTFFANIEGAGEARVTSMKQPDGTFRFFVGDREVPASQIQTPTQRTQEVRDIVIPGLSEGQTGEVLNALREQGAAVNTFTEIANQALQDIGGDARRVGTVGNFIRGFSSLTEQASAIANLAGLDSVFQGNLEDFDFGPLAGESQSVKTTLLNLVFLDLAAKGQTGRAVSDRDLEIFMDANGFSSGDPDQIASALQATVRSNRASFTNSVLIRGGGAISVGDILPDGISELSLPSERDIISEIEAAMEARDFEKAEELLRQAERGD